MKPPPSSWRGQSKYRSVKTEVDGITFDSKVEARRYGQLKLLERQGQIRNLTLQPEFDLIVNGVRICRYRGDFQYEVEDQSRPIVEDVKGYKTAVFRLKQKLLKACHGIDILVT